MILGYFTERPYRWISEDEVLENEPFFAISNSRFDREKAADDYNYWLDENCYAEELGFDALMLNEHHGNPFCMGSVMRSSVFAKTGRCGSRPWAPPQVGSLPGLPTHLRPSAGIG